MSLNESTKVDASEETARAGRAGMAVMMNRCMMVEPKRTMGEGR